MCDTIAIINRGRLIACEKTSDLLLQLDTKEITFTLDSNLNSLPKFLGAYQVEVLERHQLKLCYAPSKVSLGEILSATSSVGLTITDISTKEIELEDIFVKLIKDGSNP
jgi:ABC-2 type transport system ATP-binding protein